MSLSLPPVEPEVRATAVVVTRDAARCLDAALASLAEQTLRGLEVVLVLNGAGWSGDRDPGLGERLRVVELPTNTGFAGGANRGIEQARGAHVLLLNDDARAAPRWAEELVAAAESDPAIGSCASKVLLEDPPGHLDTAGHLLYADGLNRGRGRMEPDAGQYDETADVLFASGAAALYRREMLVALGGFDERFFAYGDDTDLGLRARLAGWRCRYVPAAVAWHRGSATAGALSARKAYLVERNRVWIAAKYFPYSLLVLNPVFAGWRYAWQLVGALTGRGRAGAMGAELGAFALAGIAARSQLDALRGLPAMLRERRRLDRVCPLDRAAIPRHLRAHGVSARTLALGG